MLGCECIACIDAARSKLTMLSSALSWAGRVGGYTATQVEEVRMVMRMLPVFFTTILFWTIYCQASRITIKPRPSCCMCPSCALTAAKHTLKHNMQTMSVAPPESTFLGRLNLEHVAHCLFHSLNINDGVVAKCCKPACSLSAAHVAQFSLSTYLQPCT